MKILMTTMSMDIGGAETHVLELSRALVRAGCAVTVVSCGGAYLPALAAAGVRHITLPLNTKRPAALIKSYCGLARLLRDEQFDIVHAHARIPAFLCAMLHRRLGFRFVTSAHARFRVNAWLRRASAWGERTITISDDLKQYLIDNYGLCPDNIITTINGIDMDRFSPAAAASPDTAALAAQIGLQPESRRLVFVSRMDTDCSLVAEQLIAVLPGLRARHGEVELILVGGGSDSARIASLAEAANRAMGTAAIHTLGNRTDVDRCIALGDIFIGVSRATLETMAEGKPVVVAGNEGWLGTLTADNLAAAMDTNFCCRGFALPRAEWLARDLDDLLGRTPEELAAMGEANLAVIRAHYSADRMAADCLAVYRTLTPRRLYRQGEVVISGYYGFGNLGDDSLLACILDNLRAVRPDLRVTVLAKNPRRMRERFAVRCIGRMNLPAILRELRGASLLISGGGSLLQDNTSTKSLLYYLAVIRLAQLCRTPVMLYANGIGPLYRARNRTRAAAALEKIDRITLRDPASLDELTALGIRPDPARITLTADPAFTLTPAPASRISAILARTAYRPDQRYYAVSLRAWHMLGAADGMLGEQAFIDEVSRAITRIHADTGMLPIFIPMQAGLDGAICRTLLTAAPEGSLLLENLTAPELCGLLSRLTLVVGMRLHMLIYATHMHLPAIGISYDPKVDAFLSYAGQPAPIIPDHAFADTLADAVGAALAAPDTARLAARDAELAALARRNAELALELCQ
ncbi:MAG: polysaccharide pyruvyl transferase CsaB [Clostridia bacterium]|nr:polysaccharide pyruvyl transferase CsaB [Clostridia bacterium]